MERQQQWPWERERQPPQQLLPRLQEKEPSAEERQREEGERTMNVHSVYVNPVIVLKEFSKGTRG